MTCLSRSNPESDFRRRHCLIPRNQLNHRKRGPTNRPSKSRTMGKDVGYAKAKPLNTKYILHNVEQESVPAAKYLWVTIADDLSWSKHIDITTKKANQTLGFLKRNIRVHKKDLKSVAYKTLVRPQLEYASTVWYPHTTTDMNIVEAVQRRAARWATRDYRYTSSVTAMLKDLNCAPYTNVALIADS